VDRTGLLILSTLIAPVVALIVVGLGRRFGLQWPVVLAGIFASLGYGVLFWVNGLSASCRIDLSECLGATASAYIFLSAIMVVSFVSTLVLIRSRKAETP
jgi:hypothetical protein